MRDRALSDHPFVRGLDDDDLLKLSACVVGRSQWEAGETVLQRGAVAEVCHLIVDGTIAIEIRPPGRKAQTLQTLHAGDLLGWSWLAEPHQWTFDARASTLSTAITLDAELLRRSMENDPSFGLEIMRRVTRAIISRLEATRLQVLDVYNR